jgi:integrase
MFRGSTGTEDLDNAIDRATEIYVKVKDGKNPRQQKIEHLKFSDVVKKFLHYKKTRILQNTMIAYKIKANFLTEYFSKRPIEQITGKDYQKYVDWRKDFYKKYPERAQQKRKINHKVVKGRIYKDVGHATINRECVLLVSILRYAKKHLGIFQGKEITEYEKYKEEPRDTILEKDEYLRLEKYWMQKNPYYWKIISFLNNTGLRYPSELNGIQWKDVYLEKSFVVIRNRKSKSGIVNSAVPLVGNARSIIEELKCRGNISINGDDYVFVNDEGWRIKNVRQAFQKSLKECCIDKKLTMYSFRHLFTTRMIKRSDIPLKVLATVLGHKDTTMLDRVYSHLHAQDIVSAFQQSEENEQERNARAINNLQKQKMN